MAKIVEFLLLNIFTTAMAITGIIACCGAVVVIIIGVAKAVGLS